MTDLFHEDVPTEFIVRVWQAMAATPLHTFQILTKRPERMSLVLRNDALFETLANVWLGTSVEDFARWVALMNCVGRNRRSGLSHSSHLLAQSVLRT